MFVLALINDTVNIEPARFVQPKHVAITEELNKKYANKVVQEVGLCVCTHDIIEASEEFIHYGDGCSYVKVKFRMVVFRPFIGEVMTGKVKSCTSSGVKVSLGFFDDITIPAAALQSNTDFDANEQVWVWKYEGEQLFMDLDEPIRFRVMNETFTDATPVPVGARRPPTVVGVEVPSDVGGNSTKIPPYSLTCSIKEDGLGLLSWWGA